MKNNLRLLLPLLSVWMLSACIHTYPDAEAEDPTLVEVKLRLKFPEDWEKIDHISRNGERLASDPDLRIVVNMESERKNVGTYKTYVERSTMKEGVSLTLPFRVERQNHTLKIWADYSDSEESGGLCYDIADLSSIKYLHPRGTRKAFDDCFTASALWTPSSDGDEDHSNSPDILLERPTARFRLVAQDYTQFIQLHEKEIRRGESYSIKISYQSPIADGHNLIENRPVGQLTGRGFSTPLEILTIAGVEVELASDLLFVGKEPSSITIDLTVLNSALMPVASISGIEVPLERGKITTVRGKLLTNLLSTGITIDNEWGEEIEITIDNQENI